MPYFGEAVGTRSTSIFMSEAAVQYEDDPRTLWMRGREILLTSSSFEATRSMILPPSVRMPVYASCLGRSIRTEETIHSATEWPSIRARVTRWLLNRENDPFA
jgi:hypothetical protein